MRVISLSLYVCIYIYVYIYIYDFISALLDQLLDQQPPILEVTTHARTAKWKELGVRLELNYVALAECHDYTKMYQLWIMEKAENATRRNLLSALRAIRQNYLADLYEGHLKTMVDQVSTQGITIKLTF